jgi:hypothetical protein
MMSSAAVRDFGALEMATLVFLRLNAPPSKKEI